ncbi:MAG: hypothetical protein AAF620_15590 [Bacteroidota bacterium]
MKITKNLLLLAVLILLTSNCKNEFEFINPEPGLTRIQISGIGNFDFTQEFSDIGVESSVEFTNLSGKVLAPFTALLTITDPLDNSVIGLRSVIDVATVGIDNSVMTPISGSYSGRITTSNTSIELLSLDTSDTLGGLYMGEWALLQNGTKNIGSLEGIINYRNELKLKLSSQSALIDSLTGFLGSNGAFEGSYQNQSITTNVFGTNISQNISHMDTLILISPQNDTLLINLFRQ